MSHTPTEDPMLSERMEGKASAKQSWWARLSGRAKIILFAVLAVLVIGLAVGLGVGLTVGNNGGGGSDQGSAPTSTFSATPSPGPTNIWQPAVNSSWQIILLQPIDLDSDATSVSPNVSVWDIDMFTNSQATITALHSLGKKVICYFSAGSYEPGRPDSNDFKDSDKGKQLDGWPGEYWLDLNSDNVRDIMKKRIQTAASKGCDAIDPDNVDGYNNDNGLGLTANDSINFLQYLSSVAQPLNLSMGLKNAGGIIPNVLNITQFSVNEQCVQYSECDDFSPFVQAGKPVFHIEYPNGIPNIKASVAQNLCSTTGDGDGADGFSTVLKNMNLDGWVEYCDGTIANTTLLVSSS